MSRTDKTRPYTVRLNDPTEPHYHDWAGQPQILNEGCRNTKCSCKGTGLDWGKRAINRRQRHAQPSDITERMQDLD